MCIVQQLQLFNKILFPWIKNFYRTNIFFLQISGNISLYANSLIYWIAGHTHLINEQFKPWQEWTTNGALVPFQDKVFGLII